MCAPVPDIGYFLWMRELNVTVLRVLCVYTTYSFRETAVPEEFALKSISVLGCRVNVTTAV